MDYELTFTHKMGTANDVAKKKKDKEEKKKLKEEKKRKLTTVGHIGFLSTYLSVTIEPFYLSFLFLRYDFLILLFRLTILGCLVCWG